jgi:hypothetical protein
MKLLRVSSKPSRKHLPPIAVPTMPYRIIGSCAAPPPVCQAICFDQKDSSFSWQRSVSAGTAPLFCALAIQLGRVPLLPSFGRNFQSEDMNYCGGLARAVEAPLSSPLGSKRQSGGFGYFRPGRAALSPELEAARRLRDPKFYGCPKAMAPTGF